MDLLGCRDLSDHAHFELANISSDKRSLRETNSFYLNDIIYECPIDLRLFTLNDVIQIRIKDSVETFATLKLAEMPLS